VKRNTLVLNVRPRTSLGGSWFHRQSHDGFKSEAKHPDLQWM